MGNPIAFDLRPANEKVIQVAAPRAWQTNAAFGAKFEGKEIFTIEKVLDSGSDYRRVVEYGTKWPFSHKAILRLAFCTSEKAA